MVPPCGSHLGDRPSRSAEGDACRDPRVGKRTLPQRRRSVIAVPRDSPAAVDGPCPKAGHGGGAHRPRLSPPSGTRRSGPAGGPLIPDNARLLFPQTLRPNYRRVPTLATQNALLCGLCGATCPYSSNSARSQPAKPRRITVSEQSGIRRQLGAIWAARPTVPVYWSYIGTTVTPDGPDCRIQANPQKNSGKYATAGVANLQLRKMFPVGQATARVGGPFSSGANWVR